MLPPPTSLFTPEIRSIKSRGFDQRWSVNAARIRGLPFEILSKRNAVLEAMQKPAADAKGKKA